MDNKEIYASLPRVDNLLDEYAGAGVKRQYLKAIVNNALEQARAGISRGDVTDGEASVRRYIDGYIEKLRLGTIRRVVNGTGVLLHTNLGRTVYDCPDMNSVARNYSNLEFDLSTGERGSRNSHLSDLISLLTGAEAAIAVNNNAAAVMLVLSALAKGREVIVSRGEQVEIGGSFRIPEVAALSGAVMKEVGTTNKTNARDYEGAVTCETAMILRVEPSNYKIIGQTGRVANEDLAAIARRASVPFYIDLGSGVFDSEIIRRFVSSDDAERKSLSEAAKHADIISFSGDKLLGSAQAGVIIGKRSLIQKLGKHPLYRAMRLDKITIYSLSQALISAVKGEKSLLEKMMSEDEKSIRKRVDVFIRKFLKKTGEFSALGVIGQKLSSSVGGGTFAESSIPSYGIGIRHSDFRANEFAALLRNQEIPIITLIDREYLYIDFRTISQEDEVIVLNTLCRLSHKREIL